MEELGVSDGLLLRARGHSVGDVAEHAVAEDEGGEVGRLQLVHQLHEPRAVKSIQCGESAAREETELQEGSHGVVLWQASHALGEPTLLLLGNAEIRVLLHYI